MSIIIKKKPNLEKLSVAELYTTLTGKSWSAAKAEGLTNGSYEQNMALRANLLKQVAEDNSSEPVEEEQEMYEGWFADTPIEKETKKEKKSNKEKINDFSKASSFGAAFKAARAALGGDATFKYKGKMFTTKMGSGSKKPKISKDTFIEMEKHFRGKEADRKPMLSDEEAEALVKHFEGKEEDREVEEEVADGSILTEEQLNALRNHFSGREADSYSQMSPYPTGGDFITGPDNIWRQFKKGGILPFKYQTKGKTPSLKKLKTKYGDAVLKEQAVKKTQDKKIKKMDKKERTISNNKMTSSGKDPNKRYANWVYKNPQVLREKEAARKKKEKDAKK